MMWTTLGLSRDPFDRCPELDDACLPNTMASTLSELMTDLRTSHGVSVVTAGAGCGKSMAVAALARRLAVTARVAVLDKPASSLTAIARSALGQLGDEADAAGDRDWITALHECVAEGAAAGRSTAIVLDDAHRLSPRTLEDLARLFGDGRSSRLHLFLFGRPRLVDRLNAATDHALDDHLLQVVELDPLSVRESVRYLERRLAICGGELLRLFDEAAVDEIVQRSGGSIARLEEIAVEALRRASGRGAARALVRDVVATARVAEDEEEDAVASNQQPLRFERSGASRDESSDWHVGDEDGQGDGDEWEDEEASSEGEWHAEGDTDGDDLSWEASDQHDDLDVELDEDELDQEIEEELEDDEDDALDADDGGEDERYLEAATRAAPARRRLVGPAVLSLAAGLALVWAANQIPGPSSDQPRGRDAVLFAEPLASKPSEILRLAATAEEADADAQVRAWLAQPRRPEAPAAADVAAAPSTGDDASRGSSRASAGETKPTATTVAATASSKPGVAPSAKSTAAKAPAAKKVASAGTAAKAAPRSTAPGRREPVYTVQLGAFKARRNAEELARKLRDKPTHILEEGGLYRVVNGSFQSKRDAASHEAKLKRAGYSTYVRTAVF